MPTKTQKAIKDVLDEENAPQPAESILYDPAAPQSIPLKIEKNGREFRVYHILNPLSESRYFQLEREHEVSLKRAKKVSTGLYEPKQRLWGDLVEEVQGYKPKSDWKEAMDQSEAVSAVNALLHVQVLGEDEVEVDETEDVLYDPDELTEIHFRALQSGTLLSLSHHFRQDSKAERDEFLSIIGNQPNDNALASVDSKSEKQKLYQLGLRILKNSTGYVEGATIPPWHLAETVKSFFARQIAKIGTSLEP